MADDPLIARVRAAAPTARVEVDGFGDLVVAIRRDLTHLEADAMSDRLQAFSHRHLRTSPNISAAVSFHHARAADEEEAESDLEAVWRNVEAHLVLHRSRPVGAAEQEAFLDLVPEFLRLVARTGRPAGWRDVDVGVSE